MTVYIDEDFDAESLEELKEQVILAVENAWASELAERERRELLPARTRPSLGYYDLATPETQKLWERKLVAEFFEE